MYVDGQVAYVCTANESGHRGVKISPVIHDILPNTSPAAKHIYLRLRKF